jgi:hypothetical protein
VFIGPRVSFAESQRRKTLMVSVAALLGMALVALGMVLLPGPNMIYLVSRSLSQG